MFTIKPARHVIGLFLRFQGFWALTAPWGVIYILPEILPTCMRNGPGGVQVPDETAHLLKHERRHEQQMNNEGATKFWMRYFWYCLRFGYWDNPYEIEARAAENM